MHGLGKQLNMMIVDWWCYPNKNCKARITMRKTT